MKIKNKYIEGTPEELQKILEDYQFSGHDVEIVDGQVVVYARRRKTKRTKEKHTRNKRVEKFERD